MKTIKDKNFNSDELNMEVLERSKTYNILMILLQINVREERSSNEKVIRVALIEELAKFTSPQSGHFSFESAAFRPSTMVTDPALQAHM